MSLKFELYQNFKHSLLTYINLEPYKITDGGNTIIQCFVCVSMFIYSFIKASQHTAEGLYWTQYGPVA